MDLRWLRAFVAVAEARHFARAAQGLDTVTSNVSAQLKALEDHLGVRLLERGRRSTPHLTAAGEVFLPEARRVLAAVEQAESVGRAAGRGLLGRVRVGYVASAAASGVLADAVAHVADGSQVEVSIEEMATPDQVEALVAGRIDVGLLRQRPELPAALASTVVLTEEVLVALPVRHRTWSPDRDDDGGGVPAAALAGERFAVPSFGEAHDARDEVAAVARAGGLVPPPVVAVRDYLAALALVASGTAVALVPECFSRLAVPGVRCARLRDVSLQTRLLLVHRADEQAPAVLRVLEGARAAHPSDPSAPAEG
ncbi:LysR substrate-binding domain-containing protein [Quadrisphaera setariae]|uniref:LysR family transcriptional regulator n=1 Tax=Quadrisphaera setariae TaxID=2593304 RepID=A0A5C8ZAG9_9ACTN|nr:LysR substrate-binding domain-containing protein [Quadrisphaera setariae]TXR55095.1 LysR family transcriptional regulator [Quadrisphaera setariae]